MNLQNIPRRIEECEGSAIEREHLAKSLGNRTKQGVSIEVCNDRVVDLQEHPMSFLRLAELLSALLDEILEVLGVLLQRVIKAKDFESDCRVLRYC